MSHISLEIPLVGGGPEHQGKVVRLSDGVTTETTLGEIGSRILREIGGSAETHALSLYFEDFGVFKLDGTGKIGNYLCYERPIPCQVSLGFGAGVIIKTLTGKSFQVPVDQDDTVESLKHKIFKLERMKPDEQRLIFCGRQLEDGRLLTFYGIGHETVIHLVRRLRGGAPFFADVYRTDALQRHEWSRNAPRWRVALEGLCVEGKCQNRNCQAFGQTVVMNAEFKNFDLITMSSHCECPMCRGTVVPVKPGFANCSYRITARKKGSSQLLQVPWTDVRNAYVTYDEHVARIVEWDRMQIFVRRLDSPPDDCPICFDSMTDTAMELHKLHCGHWFHKDCIARWSLALARKREVPTCPMCRAQFVAS